MKLLPHTWRKEYPNKLCKQCGKEFNRRKLETSNNYEKRVCCSVKCGDKLNGSILFRGLVAKFPPKPCAMCGVIFQPITGCHRFCGSKSKKTGCSRKRDLQQKEKSNRLHRMSGSRKYWKNTTKSFIR